MDIKRLRNLSQLVVQVGLAVHQDLLGEALVIGQNRGRFHQHVVALVHDRVVLEVLGLAAAGLH